MAELRVVPFKTRLRVPVGDVIEREGILIEGPAGWGECSPLPSWSDDEREAAKRAAVEAATEAFPPAARARIDVNFMLPRVSPEQAARMAVESGCDTIKIKVGDAASVERVHAVRDALPKAKIRLDANGSWDPDTAGIFLAQVRGLDIELIEDPVSAMEEMARFRRGSAVLIAAESCVRTIEDARMLRKLEAADVIVIKPQRIGGARAALDAAEEAGVPAIASSALETSVGLAMVAAVAAALPDAPFAHGVGTAGLLEHDVTSQPLVPVDGSMEPRRVSPDLMIDG
ncbi:MAG TPA: enolase C-terminal domain-like protein [Actinomycetota bacterium]|nr:enolase C-terminal domain-like protein [Actinomycetota bacterium]